MTGPAGDWRAAADEVERLLGVARNTVSIARKIEPAGRAPSLIVRANVSVGALPAKVMGFNVVVERPGTAKVRRGLL